MLVESQTAEAGIRGILESRTPSPTSSASSRPSSAASIRQTSEQASAAKPPPAPILTQRGKSNGSASPTIGHAENGRAASPNSAGAPVRRNLLYRIFHPGLSDTEEVYGRSMAGCCGSGSEAESEGEHSDDPEAGGLFGPRHRQNSLMAAMHKAEERPGSKRSASTSHVRLSSMLRPTSDTDGSTSEVDSDGRPAQPKRSASRSNLFKELLHISHKPKSQSAPTSPALHPSRPPLELNGDVHSSASAKSSDSDCETKAEHSHNLFKDLIMHARNKKPPAAGKAAEAHVAIPVALPRPATGEKPSLSRSPSENSLARYGRKEEVLGRGANAVVRLCCPANEKEKKLAIKEFRKRRKNETQKEYVKKLIAEFCISSTLHHENVVSTVDLIQDEKRHWCVVMEYCAGGDLFGRIHCGSLKEMDEVNCYFKQLVQGVDYLHSMGVAHRDLKPENLLLDKSGRILKITDFGVSEVFRTPLSSLARKAKGLCGSGPYIAPEEFETKEYDSELVDVWAIGIIYYVMVYNSIPWKAAIPSDPRYKYFLEHQGNFWPIDRLPPGPKRLMYRILEPNPAKRISIKELEEDEWFQSLKVCHENTTVEECGHKHVCTAKCG